MGKPRYLIDFHKRFSLLLKREFCFNKVSPPKTHELEFALDEKVIFEALNAGPTYDNRRKNSGSQLVEFILQV